MNTRLEVSKLNELRSKTDRQLVEFIGSRLEAGLEDARLVADAGRENPWSVLEALLASEKVYNEVSRLLPWVQGVSRAQKRVLECQLEQLRELLEESSTHAGHRTQTACS